LVSKAVHPAKWLGRGLRLNLGFIADDDSTYVNGLKVGASLKRGKSRAYYVGPGVLREGLNTIAIRVWNRSGEGGVLGPSLRAEALTGTESLDLGGIWRTKNELIEEAPSDPSLRRPIRPMGPGDRNSPGGAFSAMIAPLCRLPMKGFLWYQGEANIGQPEDYRVTFPALITDWRARFRDPNLPFYFVQLPSFQRAIQPEKANWAALREAQSSANELPYVGMAVTTDLGQADTMHPLGKREVGRRLANMALVQLYGRGNKGYSPMFSVAYYEADTVRVIFQNSYGDLKTSDGVGVRGFEILDSNGNWQIASAEILVNQIKIRATGVSRPLGVRYAWSDDPDCNLVNSAGLPLGVFRHFREKQ
jgi:sialate O-acetylesterase